MYFGFGSHLSKTYIDHWLSNLIIRLGFQDSSSQVQKHQSCKITGSPLQRVHAQQLQPGYSSHEAEPEMAKCKSKTHQQWGFPLSLRYILSSVQPQLQRYVIWFVEIVTRLVGHAILMPFQTGRRLLAQIARSIVHNLWLLHNCLHMFRQGCCQWRMTAPHCDTKATWKLQCRNPHIGNAMHARRQRKKRLWSKVFINPFEHPWVDLEEVCLENMIVT